MTATPAPDPIEQLRYTLATLIVWMSGSSVSPINQTEAEQLLKMLPVANTKKARRA